MAAAVTERSERVAVVGGGPAGLLAALSLAAAGVDTLLFAPPAPVPDRRTTALLDGSVQALDALGLRSTLRQHAAPLEKLRLVDATRRLFRAPEVLFDCRELGLDAFGHNIENETLRAVLREAVERSTHIRLLNVPVDEVTVDGDHVRLRTSGQAWLPSLVVAADGRHSVCRRGAGIETDRREFPQVALTANLRHARPHGNVSTEFHTETGPFTLVPLPDRRSSLVWVLDPATAGAMQSLDDLALAQEIERRAHSILGQMEIEGGRGFFPLSIETARRFGDHRIALVGEAGHVIPPIGAQGLNLGIRDAVAIAEFAADAIGAGGDPGAPAVTDAYDEQRRADIRSRSLAVEMFNRSLLSDFLPLQIARGLGLELAARSGLVRRALMRQGIGPRSVDGPRAARGKSA